ncbi:MAG: hypothetical protein O7C73_06365, partial [Nitrospirae bacterium]|nr:hypothetical protein [Nitrospirota bacterium]
MLHLFRQQECRKGVRAVYEPPMVRLFTAPFELLGVRHGRWASRWLSGCNRNRCPGVLRLMSLLPKRWTTG